ncbi:MAG: helix-turn-helix transcriptional regulator [Proteobacteria bacterium]|nr:helix-turn-helix transcriptional regulator [Pseudomonadota bacterium]MBU1743797.1 helix-turn-helix transcriptional regulator [Pseudomonadota bacterium]MBU4387801.1 helix-turn-helix transcriptional regulator [Candidatus Dependentiae bacterium]
MLFALGRSIREARKREGLTQAEVAKAVGIGRAALSRLESGAIREMGIRKIVRVLNFLDLELTTRARGAPPTLEELKKDMES